MDELKDNIVPLLQHQRYEEQHLKNIVTGRKELSLLVPTLS